MNKCCIIYNYAQQYRAPIFSLMDRTFDCDWYFGRNNTDIKGMDVSVLKSATLVENKIVIRSPFYRQVGVSKLALSNRYDSIIMLGDLFNLSVWNILIKNKLFHHKKIYLWSHGWYGDETPIKRCLKKIFFGLSDKVFLYGNYARQVAINQGFNSDKLVVIHNSLDYDHQVELRNSLSSTDLYKNHFGNDAPVLLFIGRLTSVKRLDLLVQAVNELRNKGKRYNVALIGDGEARLSLEQMVRDLNLTNQFWFYGRCYDDAKNSELIYNADLCVAPGNVGLTAMHTMVFGCPVLTHNNYPEQMPEFEAIQPGKTGAFFEYDNVNSLADEIERWFDNHKTDREEIRRNCFVEIESSWTPKFQIQVLKENIK